jgi:kinesin family protein 5
MQVDELLLRGEEQKRRAATAMNERSTRAHAVVVLSLRQTDSDTGVTHVSHLFLVDLGGSEQVGVAIFCSHCDVCPLLCISIDLICEMTNLRRFCG